VDRYLLRLIKQVVDISNLAAALAVAVEVIENPEKAGGENRKNK
jgi:hypothetical protein